MTARHAFEPLFTTGNSFVLFNDDAAPFELLMAIEVPEPAGGMMLVAGAAVVVMRPRRE